MSVTAEGFVECHGEGCTRRPRGPGHPFVVSVAVDPWHCDCGTEHRHGCPGHVEVCAECGWYGFNLPSRPCVKCDGVVIARGCHAHPIKGGPVCSAHGGSAPQVRKAARQRLAIADADKTLRDLDYEPVEAPVEELARLAGQVKTMVEWSAARVAALANDDLSYDSEAGIEQLRAQVGMFERFLDRLNRMLTDLAKLGLEERRLALEEWQAELVVAALRLALERSALPEAQRQNVIDAWSEAVVELEKANEPAGVPSSKKG